MNKQKLYMKINDVASSNDRIAEALLNRYANKTLKDFPREIQIEITNACNFKCTFCPRDEMKRSVGFMSMDLFKKIVDEAKDYKVIMRLNHFGESTIDPKLHEKIKYAKTAGINKVVMTTNGSLLSEEKSRQLIDAGLDDLRISVDSTNNESLMKLKNFSYDKLKSNVEMIARLAEGTSTNIAVHFVETEENHGELEEFKRIWAKAGNVQIRYSQFHNWGDVFEADKKNKFTCWQPFTSMIILWNGRVALCCIDYQGKHLLGNVNYKSIKHIWNSASYRYVREVHLKRKFEEIPMCKDCTLLKSYIPIR